MLLSSCQVWTAYPTAKKLAETSTNNNNNKKTVDVHILELSDELVLNFVCECLIFKIHFVFSAEISIA